MIVLVDADGDTARKRSLESLVADMPGTKIIAVAIQEFESWLVSDGAALSRVVSAPLAKAPQHPEKLEPAEAKALLQTLSASVDDSAQARLSLAEQLDLEVAAKKCSSFATCLDELKALKL